jgi:hypothetical protein
VRCGETGGGERGDERKLGRQQEWGGELAAGEAGEEVEPIMIETSRLDHPVVPHSRHGERFGSWSLTTVKEDFLGDP